MVGGVKGNLPPTAGGIAGKPPPVYRKAVVKSVFTGWDTVVAKPGEHFRYSGGNTQPNL